MRVKLLTGTHRVQGPNKTLVVYRAGDEFEIPELDSIDSLHPSLRSRLVDPSTYEPPRRKNKLTPKPSPRDRSNPANYLVNARHSIDPVPLANVNTEHTDNSLNSALDSIDDVRNNSTIDDNTKDDTAPTLDIDSELQSKLDQILELGINKIPAKLKDLNETELMAALAIETKGANRATVLKIANNFLAQKTAVVDAHN